MCIWSIELIWVSTYGKMVEKHILGNFRVMVHVVPCFSISIRFRILAITCSFIIQFE